MFPTSNSPDVIITVDTSIVLNKIKNTIYGNNLASYMNKNCLTNADKKRHFKNAANTLIRWPGGNGSNEYFWDGNIPASTKPDPKFDAPISGTDSAWRLTNDQYLQMLDTLGAQGIVCVNAGYAFYGTNADPIATAAHYAAQWVRYFNIQKGYNVKYWEIGNENYGSWVAGANVDGILTTGTMYGEAFRVFADSMKQADPSIQIGAVLYTDSTGYNNWSSLVLPEVENHADFLVVHEYFHPNANRNNISEADIYTSVRKIEEVKNNLGEMTEMYTSKPAGYFPVAMTEFNARSGTREISRTNALFISMCLGEFIKNGYDAVMMWDMQNGYQTEEGGDHGMISNKDPLLPDYSAYPSLYAYYFYNKYFGDRMVHSQSDNEFVKTYASTFSSGEIGLVLVNTQEVQHTVQFAGLHINTGDKIEYHTITGDGDMDRTVYINNRGPEGGPNGASGPQYYDTISPFSFELTEAKTLDLPPFSVSYILIQPSNFNTPGQTIHLEEGWNLVALNVIPPNSSIAALFPSVTTVKTLNDFWDKSRPQFSQFQQMEMGEGYLCYSTGVRSIVISGEQLPPKNRTLKAGWNLVGMNTTVSLETLPEAVEFIKNFDSFYDNASNSGTLTELKISNAYFVKVSADVVVDW